LKANKDKGLGLQAVQGYDKERLSKAIVSIEKGNQ
jgi:hypothetical protein